MQTAPSSKAAASKEAQRQGVAFESWLNEQHDEAARLGLVAWVKHVSPKVRMIGRGQWKVVGKACADFNGCAFDGKSVVIEAKSIGDARLSRSQLEPVQVEQLERTAGAGGAALVVVRFRSLPGSPVYAVPWQALPWRTKGKGASVDPADIEQWRVTQSPYLRMFFDRVAR